MIPNITWYDLQTSEAIEHGLWNTDIIFGIQESGLHKTKVVKSHKMEGKLNMTSYLIELNDKDYSKHINEFQYLKNRQCFSLKRGMMRMI